MLGTKAQKHKSGSNFPEKDRTTNPGWAFPSRRFPCCWARNAAVESEHFGEQPHHWDTVDNATVWFATHQQQQRTLVAALADDAILAADSRAMHRPVANANRCVLARRMHCWLRCCRISSGAHAENVRDTVVRHCERQRWTHPLEWSVPRVRLWQRELRLPIHRRRRGDARRYCAQEKRRGRRRTGRTGLGATCGVGSTSTRVLTTCHGERVRQCRWQR